MKKQMNAMAITIDQLKQKPVVGEYQESDLPAPTNLVETNEGLKDLAPHQDAQMKEAEDLDEPRSKTVEEMEGSSKPRESGIGESQANP
ncbi:hypothetical protein LWI28_025563 [Acer negundo]|uniref:Uncharacterized protein n=1 Tax=Acer negundo TaxID=4023 RepID=A0AAD5P372_ACENE|nr:hypothetical protein LWI28_025563 [Acer negundo]